MFQRNSSWKDTEEAPGVKGTEQRTGSLNFAASAQLMETTELCSFRQNSLAASLPLFHVLFYACKSFQESET